MCIPVKKEHPFHIHRLWLKQAVIHPDRHSSCFHTDAVSVMPERKFFSHSDSARRHDIRPGKLTLRVKLHQNIPVIRAVLERDHGTGTVIKRCPAIHCYVLSALCAAISGVKYFGIGLLGEQCFCPALAPDVIGKGISL